MGGPSTLAKRLTTLPKGVVSKNNIGARTMLDSSRLCIIREAAIAPSAMSNVPRNTRVPSQDHTQDKNQTILIYCVIYKQVYNN